MRETCIRCGMVANIDPSAHSERYGHKPIIIRDGVRMLFDFQSYSFQPLPYSDPRYVP